MNIKNKGITLIALIVTIIILLILAAVVINFIAGDGILSRSEEARFKTKMSQISEELGFYTMGLTLDQQSTDIYAGDVLKQIIQTEEIELDANKVQDIRKILKNVGKEEKDYCIVYEGKLYYVSQNKIDNNANQVKWCEDIGIRIWEYNAESNSGIKVTNGNYENVNGLYMCTPQLSTGFSKEHTRYLKLKGDNLVPGNWISKKPDDDWYDYKNQNWANIYVENNGVESYYVWLPRYCYKADPDKTQRMDIKFINTENNYINAETGETTTWEVLNSQGYKIPEFWWDNNGDNVEDLNERLPGYWYSKYQLSNLGTYTIDYSTAASMTSITIENIKLSGDEVKAKVAEYKYYINGTEVFTSKNGENHTIKNLAKGNKAVNVTALDANGEIIGSMTRLFETAEVNEPDVTKFDPDTTFYVYWDEQGNEHNEIPISMDPPDEWYDYTTANWANIVTRNNGLESYFVWIPRYQYTLDQTSKRSYVKFIKGTGTEVESGYKIPEAFWWDNNGNGAQDEGEQLTGYWYSKYQLTPDVSSPKINAEMVAGSNVIRVQDITGTLITEDAKIKYEYYLNGKKMTDAKGTASDEKYVYRGLKQNTTYTVNIIARNSETNEYLGAVTKKLTTKAINAPDVSAFNPDCTYYVIYEGDQEKRISIKEPAPENWYDYSGQMWANIVTTNGETESYFVWIPRYQYSLNTTLQRADIEFIEGTGTDVMAGYKIPEAFWWDNNGNGEQDEGEQLKGYWYSKYQLSN